jgi:hypothetical protein
MKGEGMTEKAKQNYFTEEEVNAVKKAMKTLSGVGFSVPSYQTNDPQMKVFFDKAKLWRVIKTIIQELYIKRLGEGKMFLNDPEGNEYRIIMKKKGE